MPFDGLALGGLGVGEAPEFMYGVIDAVGLEAGDDPRGDAVRAGGSGDEGEGHESRLDAGARAAPYGSRGAVRVAGRRREGPLGGEVRHFVGVVKASR